ncbi:MAG: carbon storage regulator CsrA [Treponema sp.]|jgi:carbon storage regulator|nr:carbon storage regulator CsrA [Treponema sp.]
MLILSRKLNEKIMIGDDIAVSIIEIRGDQVRIGVDAPKTVKVFRNEVFDAIKAENRAAAESTPVFPEFDFGKREPLYTP